VINQSPPLLKFHKRWAIAPEHGLGYSRFNNVRFAPVASVRFSIRRQFRAGAWFTRPLGCNFRSKGLELQYSSDGGEILLQGNQFHKTAPTADAEVFPLSLAIDFQDADGFSPVVRQPSVFH